MVYSGLSDDTGTVSQFTHIKYIYVTTNGSSTPANYQVKLTIAYEPEMKADFGDIRFNTLEHTYIDYWIESKTDSVTAIVWVELPDAITHPGSDTIWMYYGNSGLSDGSDGADTFTVYHGAATSYYLDSLVVTVQALIYETNVKVLANGHNIQFGLFNVDPAINYDSFHFQPYDVGSHNKRYYGCHNDSNVTELGEIPRLTANTFYRGKLVFDGTTAKGYFDDNEIGSGGISTNIPNTNLGLLLKEHTGNAEQKWSFVRKYITNEPTPSYGTAQHQRRVSQFIG